MHKIQRTGHSFWQKATVKAHKIQRTGHSFRLSLNRYLLSTNSILDTAQGTRDTPVNKTEENPCPHGIHILVRGEKDKQLNYSMLVDSEPFTGNASRGERSGCGEWGCNVK